MQKQSEDSLSSRGWFMGITLVLITPALSMLASGLLEGMGVSDAALSILEQFVSTRGNLAVTSSLGLIPIAMLSALLWVLGRFFSIDGCKRWMAILAFVLIVLIIAWANMTYWRAYLPSKQFLGWPHGLELVIGPMIFAPVGMIFGLIAGWLVCKFR